MQHLLIIRTQFSCRIEENRIVGEPMGQSPQIFAKFKKKCRGTYFFNEKNTFLIFFFAQSFFDIRCYRATVNISDQPQHWYG